MRHIPALFPSFLLRRNMSGVSTAMVASLLTNTLWWRTVRQKERESTGPRDTAELHQSTDHLALNPSSEETTTY